jgi:hypothetical protein
MSTDAQPRPAVASPVLLVVAGGTVSRAAIIRAARFAAGGPVIVIGVSRLSPAASRRPGPSGCPAPAGEAPAGEATAGEPERVRRAVAQAMTALENTGVMAHGHIAVNGSPARAVTRVARARGARVVVLGQRGALAAELRRRMYGSGVTVLCASGPASDGASGPASGPAGRGRPRS